ncbi:hypothetical protein T265_06006 [Opisthorchis viverrini]|uniref:Uncharacterized protein n=1 Tax=Opisthorchis viverrini TaxID=6198 RepID=A0A074ZM07_OPIVI|nr:hypothetical protein T265_06006 [Opisthorchis viverrini]KER26792.1 hypothetical protein T265_06006 [Opisthorchis viverrini]
MEEARSDRRLFQLIRANWPRKQSVSETSKDEKGETIFNKQERIDRLRAYNFWRTTHQQFPSGLMGSTDTQAHDCFKNMTPRLEIFSYILHLTLGSAAQFS